MNIAIIGAGFVGKAIASCLKEKGHTVTATCQTEASLSKLQELAEKTVILNPSCYHKLKTLIHDNDVIIVTAAAKDKEHYKSCYLDLAYAICLYLQETASKKHIIYTSSTSVYAETQGAICKEDSPLTLDNPSSKILVNTEEYYQSAATSNNKVCIFRLSEIYGRERSIQSKILRYQKHPYPLTLHAYSNMIHVEDIVKAVSFALEKELCGVYNLSDDEIITREEFYKKASNLYHIPINLQKSFGPSFHGGNKRVSNEKIKNLGFVFSHCEREY